MPYGLMLGYTRLTAPAISLAGCEMTGGGRDAPGMASGTSGKGTYGAAQPFLSCRQARLAGTILLLPPVLGLCGRGLCSREGATGVAPVRRSRSFPGSNLDPPLAKAEPISDGGSASVIAYSRR